MQVSGLKRTYEVKLPDGKKIRVWFIGDTLTKIFNAYNIKYKIINYKEV